MRCLFAGIALSLSMFACSADEDPALGEPGIGEAEQVAAGRVGNHGHVIVGTASSAVISHIPIIGEQPHDVQSLVSGSVSSLDGRPIPDMTSRGFTFVPDTFSLDALRTGGLSELQGTIHIGNFEQGGQPVVRAKFSVSRVLHQHLLPANLPATDLTVVLFTAAGKTFAAHKIAQGPSFDEIIPVTLDGGPGAGELAGGVEAVATGTPDRPQSRLGTGRPLTVTAGGSTFTVKAAGASLSCLTGPGFFNFC
jgi:hypothetical protein